MIAQTFGKVRSYNPEDHLFIFISLIYAFTVAYTISNIVDFLHALIQIDNQLWLFNNLMVLIWNILLTVLVAESWWGVWGDKKEISVNFMNFIILLIYPILLSIVAKFLSHVLITKNSTIYPHKEYALFLFGAFLLFSYLIFIRVYLDHNQWCPVRKLHGKNMIKSLFFT